MYKTCQPKWAMKSSYYDSEFSTLDQSSCAALKGTAYWVTDGKCKYSFTDSVFNGLESTSAN